MSESPNYKYIPKTRIGAALLGSGGVSIGAGLVLALDAAYERFDAALIAAERFAANVDSIRETVGNDHLARIQLLEAKIKAMMAETKPSEIPAPLSVELETKGWRE